MSKEEKITRKFYIKRQFLSRYKETKPRGNLKQDIKQRAESCENEEGDVDMKVRPDD